ncbi:DUF3231 family protein [Bacillus thermotolerans]|uniref:DUF3231 family protein n=1 Tax=Bacillus thermotolerans TaxID=1221996 RepID=A0A0F5HL14_BACTR|nr:DUF3231 family protein [Bacillus thermotolerans]KKB34059.1 hypothetical protein QY97_02661 [Bacillus thermotolerans]KKB34775.1 hypothetical protein QY96_03848 [Bacillus thermotolerans]KKB41512.1 hypothetical protein QY95_00656 [Bacillus thermotolerans]
MGILSGNPKNEPMHYGEVFSVWSALHVANTAVSTYQVLLNHSGDTHLRKLVQDMIEQGRSEAKQLEELLKENGIGLPPGPMDRPEADVNTIPAGARYQDADVAAIISSNNATALTACSQIIGQCIREDIAAMFLQFHTQKAALGVRLLQLNKDKGWLVAPPLHHKEPVHV